MSVVIEAKEVTLWSFELKHLVHISWQGNGEARIRQYIYDSECLSMIPDSLSWDLLFILFVWVIGNCLSIILQTI